jgi:hypothetical protein
VPPASVPSVNVRRRRIERELRALHAMQSQMSTRSIVLSVLGIPALALLCFLAGAKLHLAFGNLWISILVALGGGGAIWLIGRRWFTLAALIVLALLLIVLEALPDVWQGYRRPNRKTARRLKLEQAIAKREAILGSLNAA